MTEREIEIKKTTTIQTFKARIKASKPHYVEKVMVHKTKVEDALEPHFCSYITVFVPKIKRRQPQPVTMCHVSNGGGACLFRCENPIELAEVLRHVADAITSDRWLDRWMQLQDIADHVIDNDEILLDEEFVDVGDFKNIKEKNSKSLQENEEKIC